MAEKLEFAVALEDLVSPSAKKASAGLKDLENKLKTSKTQLSEYQAQLTRAKAIGDIEGYRKYSTLVEGARRKTFELNDSMLSMKGAAGESGEAMSGLAGGPMAIMAVAALAAVEAGKKLVEMLVDIAVEGVKTAIEVNAVNERLTATFEALGDKPGAGKKTLDFLNKLSTQLPQSRAELAKWTQEFEAFGITDLSELRNQIKATASAQAIAGDEGAQSYKKLAEKIQDAVQGHHRLKMGKDVLKDIALSGANAAEVAKKLGLSLQAFDAGLKGGTIDAQRFGNALSATLVERGKEPLAAMGNELGTLLQKGKETFEHLFDGIDASPITDAIKSVISLGDVASPSGANLKKGIGEGIQGIINWLGKMLTEAEVVFLTMELYAVTHRKQLQSIERGFGLVGTSILGVGKIIEWLIPKAEVISRVLAGIGTGGLSEVAIAGTKLGLAIGDKIAPPAPSAGLGAKAAPAHAAGGMVHKPAAGEFFASVAPGEMILPRQQSRQTLGMSAGFGQSQPMMGPREPMMMPRQRAPMAMGGSGLSIGARAYEGPREMPQVRRQMREVSGPGIGAGARSMMSASAANTNARGGGGTHIDHLELTIQAPSGVTDATSLSVTGLTLALERLQLASGR